MRAEKWNPSRPFLRADGLARGLTKHQVDSRRFHRLFGSVRVRSDLALTPEGLAAAALLVAPSGSWVSHHSAARLWGGAVPDHPDTHVSVSTPSRRRRRPGLSVHLNSRGAITTAHRGLRVTTPEQTFLDLAGNLGLVDLVVLGDSLVKNTSATPASLVEAGRRWSGPHHRIARKAAALVRDRVESPMETRVRLLVIFAGLPEPEVNTTVAVAGGRIHYRLDLSFPAVKLAIEYDGRQHAESTHQWGSDITRRENLESEGWRIVVLRSADVFIWPWETVLRIRQAASARGLTVPSGPPPVRFVRYFPSRSHAA